MGRPKVDPLAALVGTREEAIDRFQAVNPAPTEEVAPVAKKKTEKPEADEKKTEKPEETPRRPKRQMKIPGTEPKSIREVDVAAERYVEARDKRMKLTEEEKEAHDALVAAMKKHGLENYRDEDVEPPLVVTIIPGKDKAKVSEAKDDDGAEAEE